MKLNQAQQEVVENVNGPACIVAPPGSGKTHTLVQQILFPIIENKTTALASGGFGY